MKRVTKLFFVLYIIFFSSCQKGLSQKEGISLRSPEQTRELINNHKEIQILDVRTSQEFLSSSLKSAKNISVYSSNFNQSVQQLDKSKPTLVYCKSGGRSRVAASKLLAMGFKEIYDLDGGIMAWSAKNYPLENDQKKGSIDIQQFENLSQSGRLVLFDFKAKWCGPCKLLSPILDSLQENQREQGLRVVNIDVDEESFITDYHKIQSIPFLMFYKNGKLVATQKGYQPSQKEELLENIINLLN